MSAATSSHEITQLCRDILQSKLGATLKLTPEGGPVALVRKAQIRITSQTIAYDESIIAPRDSQVTQAVINVHVRPKHCVLLLARYVREKQGSRLRAAGIDYVDIVGNMSIRRTPIDIWHHGAPPPPREEPSPGRIFSIGGLRLLTSLLCRPSLVNESFRTIAHAVGLSIGSVWALMHAMTAGGYIEQIGADRRRIASDLRLFDLWLAGYSRKLRAASLWRRCRLADNQPLQSLIDTFAAAANQDSPALISGELAAAQLVGHIVPQSATLLVEQGREDEVMQRYKLVPAADGNIALCALRGDIQLLRHAQQNAPPLANPLLIYADLDAGDLSDRLRETMDLLADKFIRPQMEALRYG